MDKNINKQTSYYSKMGKILITIFLLMLSLISVNAVQQKSIIEYNFESTSGVIAFDNSENQINSLLLNGALFKIDQLKWGIANALCDGTNDYIQTMNSFNLSNKFSISLWVRPTISATNDTFFSIYSNNELLELSYTGNVENNIVLSYYNSTNQKSTQIIENVALSNNVWTNLILIIDRSNGKITYYRDNTPILYNVNFFGGYKYNVSELKNMDLCRSNNAPLNSYSNMRIDATYIYNFELNTTQINELYTTDNINYLIETPIINDTEINLTNVQTLLINNSSPLNNAIVTKFDNIFTQLNTPSTCELYLDNNLIYTTSQRVYSFSYPLSETNLGSHSYLVYCYYTENNIKYYDVSNYINFELQNPSKTINFYISDVNNNLMVNDDLYLSTPCPNSKELGEYWILERPFYIQKLVSGYASYNLSYNDNYEFCLLKGKVNYAENSFTENVDFVDVNKVTSLGILYVTNETLNYNLKVTNEDLYKASQPEFWGKTWSSLFTLIISLILGGLLIFIGVRVESKILIYIGGVIIAGGLGISVSNIIWGGLF